MNDTLSLRLRPSILFSLVLTSLLVLEAQAGVFNIPHFVAPGGFALGLEPEFTLINEGTKDTISVGANLRYSHGINDLNNVHVIVGTGGAARAFRAGGVYSFDFFPDVANQPGIGFAVQSLYVKRFGSGSMEITGYPYIHKSFTYQNLGFDPFLAFPAGIELSNGRYRYLATLTLGFLFQHSEHFNSILELGIRMNNSGAYVSGGFVYYH